MNFAVRSIWYQTRPAGASLETVVAARDEVDGYSRPLLDVTGRPAIDQDQTGRDPSVEQPSLPERPALKRESFARQADHWSVAEGEGC